MRLILKLSLWSFLMIDHGVVRRQWFQLMLLFIAFYGLNLLIPRDFWVQDEMRYGEVVREMLADGNWLVPHLNAYPYPDKPAFYFWIVAWVGAIVGQGEFAFRLVSVLSTLLAGVGVYQLGNRMAGKPHGFLAAIMFGSLLLTMIVGQIMRMDMLLTAATLFAWFHLLNFEKTGTTTALVWFWVCCLLGLAVKGPIALMFNLLPAIVWFIATRGASGLAALRPILGLLAMAGLVLAWIFAVYQSGQSEYLATIWHQQLVGRAVNSWSHKEPFYFYVMLLPLLLMPWTSLILKGCWQLLSKKLSDWQSVPYFIGIPLIAISMVSGKLFIYLEPLMPAMALAGAMVVGGLMSHAKTQSTYVSAWITWPPALFLFGLGALISWLSTRYLVESVHLGVWLAIVLFVLAVLSAISARFSFEKWFYSMTLITVLVSCILFGGVTTITNSLFSGRALGTFVAERGNDKPIAVVNATRGILNYYANRTFTELNKADVLAWMKANPEGLIIIKTKDLETGLNAVVDPSTCAVNQQFEVELKEYYVLAKCGT
jgi:4-amino-4-deoxy-L-arabinose transferase-like glycosyltransferase